MVKDSNETPIVQETEVMDTEAPAAVGEDESASTAEESTTEKVDERSELEEAKAQAAEYLEGWQRARAEFANFRRRQEQQKKQLDASAKTRVLTHLMPVVDDLERAFESVPKEIADHAWVSGLSLVGQKWTAAMEKVGVSALTVEPGDAFDPTVHEALTHEPNDEFEEGTVIQAIQRGYMLDDIVIRPALVRVSSGKPAE
jgi:molecular chaperone GrpE